VATGCTKKQQQLTAAHKLPLAPKAAGTAGVRVNKKPAEEAAPSACTC
jgi:hypothetical protein